MRTISIVSRVVCTGLANRTPCQPSMTPGPDTPIPRRKRPPESDCSDSADEASSAGDREPSWTTNVPTSSVVVRAAIQASPVSAS